MLIADDLDESNPFATNKDLEDNKTVIDNDWLGCVNVYNTI